MADHLMKKAGGAPPPPTPGGSSTITSSNGKLFREYIGAQSKGVRFSDVITYHDAGVEHFDMILAFAIDYDLSSKEPTDGMFRPSWDVRLTAEEVLDFKRRHKNVRVMVSIGGDTVQGEGNVNFMPTKPGYDSDGWVTNAVTSLVKIMTEYHLDGIDVNYEHFDEPSETNVATFVRCIKALLRGLKEKLEMPNMVTSIAPYYDYDLEKPEPYYQALWNSCRDDGDNLIDYVNFQFYSGDRQKRDDAHLAGDSYERGVYDVQVANYPGAKVLAAIKTGERNNESNWLEAHLALKEARRLHSNDKLPGIFIWSADSSYDDKTHLREGRNKFFYEKEALKIVRQTRRLGVGGSC